MTDELDEEKDEETALEDGDVSDGEVEDIDPSEITADETEDLVDDGAVAVNPEEDPFGFGAFGELDEDGEFSAPADADDDDEKEDEISEDLF